MKHNMFKTIGKTAAVFTALFAFAVSAEAATLTASNQEELVLAVGQAVNGDTIELSATAFYIGEVPIGEKTLTFRGQGAGQTTIGIGSSGDGNQGYGSNASGNMTFEDVTLTVLPGAEGVYTGFRRRPG